MSTVNDLAETQANPRRKRRTSLVNQPAMAGKVRQWKGEARPWLRAKIEEFTQSDQAKDGQDFTTGDIRKFMDAQDDQPIGYSMLEGPDFYTARYNLVRTALENLVGEGVLVHTETVNVRGVKTQGYMRADKAVAKVQEKPTKEVSQVRVARGTDEQKTAPKRTYSVIIDSDKNKSDIEARIYAFLEEHKELLGDGFRGLLLSRK